MKHNTYADGNVQNIEFSDNTADRSIGIVKAGSYTFTPDRHETVECLSGHLVINEEACPPGESIVLPKDVPFTIAAEETSSYICLYT